MKFFWLENWKHSNKTSSACFYIYSFQWQSVQSSFLEEHKTSLQKWKLCNFTWCFLKTYIFASSIIYKVIFAKNIIFLANLVSEWFYSCKACLTKFAFFLTFNKDVRDLTKYINAKCDTVDTVKHKKACKEKGLKLLSEVQILNNESVYTWWSNTRVKKRAVISD